MKIIVKVPKTIKGKWQASIGSAVHINRNNAKYLWKRLEKKVLALSGKTKIHLKVKYGHRYHNEGIYNNLRELHFAYKAFCDKKLISYLESG